jgi:hypothetical protein
MFSFFMMFAISTSWSGVLLCAVWWFQPTTASMNWVSLQMNADMMFSLETGCCIHGVAVVDLACAPVFVRDGDVALELELVTGVSHPLKIDGSGGGLDVSLMTADGAHSSSPYLLADDCQDSHSTFKRDALVA